MKAMALACAVVACLAVAPGAAAQESKSAPLAKQLVAALDAAKLDSIAAKDPASADVYIGALYIPGFQLLVVSGKYSAPILLDTRIYKKEYRDTYIDLNSSSPLDTRLFIEDLGADGLHVRREDDRPFDSIDLGGKRTMLDSDWKRQKISEADYMKTYASGDERYAEMLTLLLAQLKK